VRAPGELLIESRFSKRTVDRLAERGHRVKVEGPWELGRVFAAERSDGMLRAGATTRFM
jgi:gamma-glutamyltranspeptidase/glutathione hydrolase